MVEGAFQHALAAGQRRLAAARSNTLIAVTFASFPRGNRSRSRDRTVPENMRT
jgi:hypothetical protein